MGGFEHPSLVKGQTYQLIEKLVAQDVAVTREQLETFIELLNKDLPRKDNARRILNIFDIVLDKMQNGVFPIVSQICSSMPLIMNYLIEALQQPDENIKILTHLTETLVRFSAGLYPVPHSALFQPMISILKIYFNRTDRNVPHGDKILKIFESFIKSLSNQDRTKFVEQGLSVWLKDMISFIFLKENKERQFGLTVCDSIFEDLITLQYLNSPEWPAVIKNITDSKAYPEVMVNLLKQNDPLWEQLWICIIKITRKELHKIGGAINPLLFVIQEAFKSSVEFKIKSFHCLRELVNNYTLDVNILYNAKRIQVVTVALESNNAKTKAIAVVKYETWWHFISKLGPDVIKYEKVLKSFFKFCFGEPNANVNASFASPGRVFPPVQKMIIKSFIELCGHRESCGCTKIASFHLGEPIIGPTAIEKYKEFILHGLKQVTVYAHTHMSVCDKELFDENVQSLKCTWASIVLSASKIKSAEANQSLLRSLIDLVANLIETSMTDPLFAEIILTIIIPSLIVEDGYSAKYLNQEKFKYLDRYTPIQALIRLILTPTLYHKENVNKVYQTFEDVMEVGLSHDENNFPNWFLNEIEPANNGTILWCSMARVLSNQSNQINAEVISSVLMWPLFNEKLIDDDFTILNVLVSWKKLYGIPNNKIKIGKQKTLATLKEEIYAVIDQGSRGFFAFIITAIIKKQAEEKSGDTSSTQRLSVPLCQHLNMFEKGNLSNVQLSALVISLKDLATIMELYYCHSLASSQSTEVLIPAILKLINVLITHYDGCEAQSSAEESTTPVFINLLLDSLNSLQSSTYFNKIASRVVVLICILLKVYKHSLDIETKCCDLLNSLLKNKSNIKLESSEIISIKQTLDSIKKVAKDVKKETKKDDDFVVIKPNWKFDPKNLTDRQIDALKRRRDDIPALHEDLSQSQDEYSLQVWKLPGYNSEDSSKSADKTIAPHISERIAKMINNCNGSDSELRALQPAAAASPLPTPSKIVDPSKRTAQLIKMCTPESKENRLKAEEKEPTDKVRNRSAVMKESNGTIQSSEKITSAESPATRKKKSILLRLRENINKTLKCADSKDDEIEEVKIIDIKQNEETEVVKIIKNKENDDIKLDESVIETPVEASVIVESNIKEDERVEPQKEDNNKVETQPMDVDVDTESEIPPTLDVEVVEIEKNTLKRPIRAKRKTSKLLASEEVKPTRRYRRRNSTATLNLEKEIQPDPSEVDERSNLGNADEDKKLQIQPSVVDGERDSRSNSDNEEDKNSQQNIDKPNKNKDTKINKEKKNKIKTITADINNDKDNSQLNLELENADINKKSKIQPSNIDKGNNSETKLSDEDKDNSSQKSDIEDNLDLNSGNAEKDQKLSPSDTAKDQDSQLSISSEEKDQDSEIKVRKTRKRRLTIAIASENLDSQELKKKKSKSRLLSQLQIETNEGHPLILNCSEARRTRRSSTVSASKPIDSLFLKEPIIPCKSIFSQETEEMSGSMNTESSQDVIGSSQEDTILFRTVLSKSNKSTPDVTVNEPTIEKIAEAETEPFVSLAEADTEPFVSLAEADTEPFVSPTYPSDEPVKLNTSIVMSPCIDHDDERTLEFLNDTVNISPIKVSSSPEESGSPQSKDPTSPDLFTNEKISPVKTSPPKAKKPNTPSGKSIKSDWTTMIGSRTAQMFSLCMQDDKNAKLLSECDSDLAGSPPKLIEHMPLLGFTKDLSSAMASPVGPSILKRKHEADEFGSSPASKAKKRRVSFHDPPVSTTMSVEKYLKPYSLEEDPPTKPERPKRVSVVAKCLLNKIENHASEFKPVSETDSQLSEVCSLTVDSPPPLGIITNHMLDDTDPIYPNLIDCHDSISVISVDLSSQMWKDNLLEELKDKVVTIGDLAKLSELEVNRLPIKTPKIQTVLKVLGEYYDMISNKVSSDESLATEVLQGLSETQFKSSGDVETPIEENLTEIFVAERDSTTDVDITVCEEADFNKMLDNVPVLILKDYIYNKIECESSFKEHFKDIVESIANKKKLNLFRDSLSKMLSEMDS